MLARSWTSCAFWIPVFLERNFFSKSVVVIGLLFRYLRNKDNGRVREELMRFSLFAISDILRVKKVNIFTS